MFYSYLGVDTHRAESLLCAIFAFVRVHIRQTSNLLQSRLFPQGHISKAPLAACHQQALKTSHRSKFFCVACSAKLSVISSMRHLGLSLNHRRDQTDKRRHPAHMKRYFQPFFLLFVAQRKNFTLTLFVAGYRASRTLSTRCNIIQRDDK